MLKALPGARGMALWVRRTFIPHYREIHRLRRAEAEQLLQPYPTTGEDRYPEVFDELARLLKKLPCPQILSFGCSSGAEVRALRRRMPHARIVGIDLNRRMIAQARAADPAHAEDYRRAGAPEPGERFDAVLAMAVFRHGDLEFHRPETSSAILPFARFEKGLSLLDQHLNSGGWLALFNQQFRFADCTLAPRYAVEPLRMAEHQALHLLYGPDDRRIAGTSVTEVLFRKQADG